MNSGNTTRIVTVVTVVTAVAGILAVASYFRRRRKKAVKSMRKLNGSLSSKEQKQNGPVPVPPSARQITPKQTPTTPITPTIISSPKTHHKRRHRSGSSSSRIHHRTGSFSFILDGLTSPEPQERDESGGEPGSMGGLLQLGTNSFEKAIRYWEEALHQQTISSVDQGDQSQLLPEHEVLESLIDQMKQLCAQYVETYARLPHQHLSPTPFTSQEFDDAASDASSTDSFFSAGEEEFEELAGRRLLENQLYEVALSAARGGLIECRTMRAKLLHCKNKEDFLAKVHCIRQAMALLFQDETTVDWFADMGMHMIGDVLATAGYATEDFFTQFNVMMQYIKEPSNWSEMEEELRGRQVKFMSFYDIVIDFLLLDAFDDLADPPQSVLAIVQNRWLSQGVKETGLSAAVWSVLAAKKRMLKMPNGFIAKVYDISYHVSPALAWGFMGTDEDLKSLMDFFKDQVMNFTRAMFSMKECRFSTVPELADDIFNLARQYSEVLNQRLSS